MISRMVMVIIGLVVVDTILYSPVSMHGMLGLVVVVFTNILILHLPWRAGNRSIDQWIVGK